MTISTDTATASYTGNGTTTAFPIPFYFLVDTDVKISKKVGATGAISVLTLNSDYTLTGAGDQAGGTATMTTAPLGGTTPDQLFIERNVSAVQETAYPVNSSFPAASHEKALDRLTMLAQQILAKLTFGLFRDPLTAAYDAGGNPVGNAADAVASTDLTTLGQVQQMVVDGAAPFLAGADGASLIGLKRTDLANAVASTVEAMVNNDVIVPTRDYGFDNTGATANDTPLATLLASIQLNADGRGRRIRFLSGTYKFNSEMAFTAYAAGLVHNIIVEGDGPANTVLDFSGAPAGSNGVSFDAGAHFVVRNLEIANAPQDNLVIGKGNTVGGAAYCSMWAVENVRMQAAGRHNLSVTNAYMGTIRDCWAKSSGQNNFNFNGYSTSLAVSRNEGSSAGGTNWAINGVAYSEFSANGSDNAGQFGWALSNLAGVVFNGCGAESNQKDNWLLFTSDASATGIPAQVQDIHGVVFSSCFGLSGSLAAPGVYASFINANTANGRAMDFKILGGSANGATASDRALILSGASGQVTCHKELFRDAGCTAADSVTGTVEVKNSSVTGRRCIVTLSASQSIPSAAATKILFDTIASNDLGATLSSGNIVLPRGVNKVRITASVNWGSSATGTRYMEVDKNAAGGLATPASTVSGVAAAQPQMLGSVPISVVAGDTFSLTVTQTSGGALNANNGNLTYLCVEAIN